MIDLSRYEVRMVPAGEIEPSPENDEVYGPIDFESDSKLNELVESIHKRGLAEPIILSADGFIISGHRRFFACVYLEMEEIPCRYIEEERGDGEDWHRTLIEFNPQRIKGVSALLKEAMLRESVEDTADLIQQKALEQEDRLLEVDTINVLDKKEVRAISERRQPFLEAVQKVVVDFRELWPLSVRQIHYQLLNNPPLTQEPKRTTKGIEAYRYRNDKQSSTALINLCRDARYAGLISIDCINDATRPQIIRNGDTDVSVFINREIEWFLTGYQRDLIASQPFHIECFGEKNTLINILKPVCWEYFIPLTLGRGYCSTPVWRDMARRFRKSGKQKMILLVVSDYDPEGRGLAQDAIKSLRHPAFGVEVEAVRVAVTERQIADFDLHPNPAKEKSTRLKSFIKETGGTDTYECEALPPAELQKELRRTIESVLDMDLFRAEQEREAQDVQQVHAVRRRMIEGFSL